MTSQDAYRTGPRQITHAGRRPTAICRHFRENDETVTEVADALTAAGIETTVTDRVRDAVWEKVLVNLGINAVTALARVQNGAIAEYESGRSIAADVVADGPAFALGDGPALRDDIVEYVYEIASETAQNRSSMRQDVEAGRTTEIETLNGALVERAERRAVDVPVNRTLTRLVRLAEAGYGG